MRDTGSVQFDTPGQVTDPFSPPAQFADAATTLLGCGSTDEVYHVIGEFMTGVVPGSIVIVNEAAPDSDQFITRGLFGLDDSVFARAAKLVGFQIIGKRSTIVPKYRALMLGSRLSRVDGGFAEFASSEVSPTIGALAAKIAGIRDVYTIGIVDGDSVLGNIHLCTRQPNAEVPAPLVERFVLHTHAALARLSVARDLEESNERFQQAVRTTMDGFWSYGADGRLLDVNQAYCQMSGYTHQQLLAMRISDLEMKETPDEIDAHNRLIIERGQDRYVSQHRRSDGSLYDVEVSVSYLPSDGDRFFGFIRDITERRQAEERILRLNAELEERVGARTRELSAANAELMETNAELERATLAKSDFLASMSHELRTPLNSIIGFTHIIREGLAGPINEEQATQLAMVGESGKHLLSLINDILDLSRIEAGRVTPCIEEVDLGSLVEGARGMVDSLADAKGLRLVVTIEPGIESLRADPRHLTQILVNLLGNAIKFTDSGTVSLGVSGDSDWLEFAVSDTGRGIGPSDMPHVMESFYQVDMPDRISAGTGLGLAISSQLAAMLGGSLAVESELGVGSTFTLRVPKDSPPECR
ncbi:MAG: ATP-binding protein [Coriobacteriia bacterium]|nr:ATP-binding protein [Coriobacteriia bacterium]